jgi:hypothetical protein
MVLSQVSCSESVDDQPWGLNLTIEPPLCLHIIRKFLVPIFTVRGINSNRYSRGAREDFPLKAMPSNMYCEVL